MKKVLVAVALVMGLGSSVAFAQNAENANAVVATAQAPQDEYTKIEVKDLPAAVTEALGKAYPESTIKEASVTTKEEGKFYKVVVTQKDGTDVTVVLNETFKGRKALFPIRGAVLFPFMEECGLTITVYLPLIIY